MAAQGTGQHKAKDHVADLTPVLKGDRPAHAEHTGASVSAVLSQLGETLYEWDLETDRIRWAGNAAAVLGLADLGKASTGRKYAALVDPESLTDRHQAVLNGIGVDSGEGVAYDIVYALKLETGRPRIWVQDFGLWFADAEGRPYLARGILRLQRNRPTISTPQAGGLPRRAAFLRIVENVLCVARHYRTDFAFAILSVENLAGLALAEGPAALERAEEAIERRLRRSVRGGDPTGWLSDHEIGLALRIGHEDETRPALMRIVEALSQEIAVDRGRFTPEIAAGILFVPGEAETLSTCVEGAREALARARRAGPRGMAFSRATPGDTPAEKQAAKD